VVEVPRTSDGSALSLLALWEDTPHTGWFGLGMTTSPRREYALETTEFIATARRRVGGPVNAFADVGVMHANASEFGRSTWVQTALGAAVDTRTSPGYTRRGGLYAASMRHLAARTHNQSSFDRMVVDLRHFIPLMDENWVIAMQGRAELTANAGSAPAFLLPYVGGGSGLRGYSEYRFTGQQSVLIRGEVRWVAGAALDLAAFIDHGTVADRVGALAMSDMRRGWGIGARLHGDTFTALRVDVAHGSEGWHLHVGQTASF
jgi:hemolysin activation/secretion protein